MKANSAVYQTIMMIKFIALMSACSPTQATPTNIPQPATTRAAVPTNTSAPSATPSPVEFVQSITAGPDPIIKTTAFRHSAWWRIEHKLSNK